MGNKEDAEIRYKMSCYRKYRLGKLANSSNNKDSPWQG